MHSLVLKCWVAFAAVLQDIKVRWGVWDQLSVAKRVLGHKSKVGLGYIEDFVN